MRPDGCAQRAATEDDDQQWGMDDAPFRNPMQVVNAVGAATMEMDAEVGAVWWRECRDPKRRGRRWMNLLYPEDVTVDAAVLTAIFRRPIV